MPRYLILYKSKLNCDSFCVGKKTPYATSKPTDSVVRLHRNIRVSCALLRDKIIVPSA